jgi:hypothetical protein
MNVKRTRVRLAILIPAAVIAAVPLWGYLQARSHGTGYVSIHDVAQKTDRQIYGWVRRADLTFRDETGTPLASGAADSRFLHPELGDCRAEERQGGRARSDCFDALSRWLMPGARRVHHATVRLDDRCTIERVPVVLEESREAWWLWWVPHPHLDNSTSTHFDMTMRIDSAGCRPADAQR